MRVWKSEEPLLVGRPFRCLWPAGIGFPAEAGVALPLGTRLDFCRFETSMLSV
jgi:hypothetical protein